MKQREIKFRQKNKTKKGWHYWGIFKGEFVSPINCGKDSQQFTGLKDKNGKEIYEGDIVEFEDESGTTEDEIVFGNGSFIAKNNPSWHVIFSEVIGNIYENPKLLKINEY